MEVRSADGHLRIHAGSEPVLLRRQVRLEDRTEHQHHGGLDHAILHRRDAQRPLATISFWDPYTKKRLGCISLAPQLFLQRSEPLIGPAGLDRREVNPVDTRRAGIGPATSQCFSEHIFPTDLVPQAVKSIARFRLGFRL
jgi:hypothetical protein